MDNALLSCLAPQNTYYSELLWLLVTLLVLLLVGRALYVVPACWLHNLWSSEKVSVRDVVIIWCAPTSTLTLTTIPDPS